MPTVVIMNDACFTPVILAGGCGTRLWPESRKNYPKQFLKLFSDKSLFQQTILRLKGLPYKSGLVIGNNAHRFIIAEQLREINASHFDIILEPFSKNSAPAIALAAFHVIKHQKQEKMVVLASDHLFDDEVAFRQSINRAISIDNQQLITFAAKPTRIETGYGYIQKGKQLSDNCYQLLKFHEKPNIKKAKRLIEKGYLWNSGQFVFKAKDYLDELNAYQPQIYHTCEKSIEKAMRDLDFIRIDEASFGVCPSDSIDYAVMEKTTNACVMPFDAGWKDVGSWLEIYHQSQKDNFGNSIKGEALLEDSHNNLIRSEKLVCALGVNDLAIIDTADALLITPLNQSQQVKTLVQSLEIHKPEKIKESKRVYRPWGFYEVINEKKSVKVKRLSINPGEKLSTQKHLHRSEHWLVVKGVAKVIKGDKAFLIQANASSFIAKGMIHSLENPGKDILEMIEVQTGVYLGEDDIVRFEDRYGRVDGV